MTKPYTKCEMCGSEIKPVVHEQLILIPDLQGEGAERYKDTINSSMFNLTPNKRYMECTKCPYTKRM